MLDWIRAAHETSQWTTSVCTGSLLLGAAGLLEGCGRRPIGWSWRRWPVPSARARRRVVEQGKIVTAAGVSSGIDMALVLAARIAGPEIAQAIQLGLEYDPEPPFDSGSEDKAPEEIVELVRASAAQLA